MEAGGIPAVLQLVSMLLLLTLRDELANVTMLSLSLSWAVNELWSKAVVVGVDVAGVAAVV